MFYLYCVLLAKNDGFQLSNVTLKFIRLVAGKRADGGVWQASVFGKSLLCLKSVIWLLIYLSLIYCNLNENLIKRALIKIQYKECKCW